MPVFSFGNRTFSKGQNGVRMDPKNTTEWDLMNF